MLEVCAYRLPLKHAAQRSQNRSYSKDYNVLSDFVKGFLRFSSEFFVAPRKQPLHRPRYESPGRNHGALGLSLGWDCHRVEEFSKSLIAALGRGVRGPYQLELPSCENHRSAGVRLVAH